ncbi:beta-ketoacyl-[acyl-carrier-protein] synthase family protein [Actinomadura sp. NEAU-AAG7]|uniref:beta-ketoacyl-[acyl-carrier-protein] synthase family protein n=1 Tax=Actinomadura sp. NEAU-AAG7 TaxID=2839640 RepID=UPI002547C919|nr:beta-ketoacyl-[acyl-carrier-protein] synthase family protein [Actinomadura sp. NEAU-AAG7]
MTDTTETSGSSAAERTGSGRTVRVVVTAVGALTAQGAGAEALWDGVRDGRVAIGPVTSFPMGGYQTEIGGEVPDGAAPRRVLPAGLDLPEREDALDFALAAAEEALAASGLAVQADGTGPARAGAVAAHRFGVAFGTCNGGLRTGERVLRRLRTGGAPVRPGEWLVIPPHAIAEGLSAVFGLKGPCLSVNTACASGAHALAHALEAIRAGRADAMLVGGSDAFTETGFAGFSSLQSLSSRPAAPYSKDRDGLSLGAGGGMLVLVEESLARAAGAPVLAEVLGYGLSADGHHATAPHPQGEGAARAIREALGSAGLEPGQITYINGHGTGTPKNDSAESNAVRAALGEAAEKTALSSTKSMIGHLLGAAGAVEAAVTVLALRDQVVPPTAGFTRTDPRCGLDPVPGASRPTAMDAALSNNFAFAGANASLAFGRPGSPLAGPPPTATEKVVVTGIGVISASGASGADLWRAYRAGERPETTDGAPRFARVEIDPRRDVPPRERRRMDRLGRLAVAAAREALEDAGLEGGERVGVIVGTGLGPMRSVADFLTPVLADGPAAANPAIFPNTVFNAAAGQVAMVLGTRGPTSTATAGHAAGASALCVAHDLLRTGRADAVVCPAVDELSPAVLEAYRALPLFSGPSGRRYTLTEGGIALVLERESAAKARNAPILGEFAGHGSASDARGIGAWAPDGDGLRRAMRAALDDGGVEPGELTAIWANAAGLMPVDRPETRAVRALAPGCTVESPKRLLGEPVGAGAQLSAALALTGWRSGAPAGPVLVNSSSLGGTHYSLVLRPRTEI